MPPRKKPAAPPPQPSPDIQRQRAELMSRFYTEADICALLALPGREPLCTKTLQRMIEKGEFPVPKTTLPGRVVVYRRDPFHEWRDGDFIENRTSRPARRRRNGRASTWTAGNPVAPARATGGAQARESD